MKKLIITSALILLSLYFIGQENSIEKYMEVRIGLSDLGGFMDYDNVYGVYNLNLNYRFSKYFGAGIQGGYGGVKFYDGYGGGVKSGNVFRGAATGTLYLSPLFLKKENSNYISEV